MAAPTPHARPIRAFLDTLYRLAGFMAAACMIAMLGVIIVQMVARWSSLTFPGGAEYAGYLMAASSFLAFSYALNNGAHIRVGLLLSALGRHKFWAELWCLVIGTAATGYLAWFALRMVYWSRKLNDISQGQDATPIWLAQLPVAAGAVLLAICFFDNLVTLIMRGHDNIIETDEMGQGE